MPQMKTSVPMTDSFRRPLPLRALSGVPGVIAKTYLADVKTAATPFATLILVVVLVADGLPVGGFGLQLLIGRRTSATASVAASTASFAFLVVLAALVALIRSI